MATQLPFVVSLSEMVDGQEGDFFALMTAKDSLTTRDGKSYFKVGFRDANREVSFPVWNDSPWAVDCRDLWTPGEIYKVRATYRETNYGPQLEINQIRPVSNKDAAEGFDPTMFLPHTRFNVDEMFDELLTIAKQHIADGPLASLVAEILKDNRPTLISLPAATHNHHAFAGGYVEHVLSVTRTGVFLADKYAQYYPDLQPPLSKDLVIAGCILHDIGKIRELQQSPQGASYTAAGELIGHILQGRDIVREATKGREIDPETLLRLEHIIVSHQRLPEWGSPKPPMTPEALLVHYADDMDAKFNMMVSVLSDDTTEGPLTSSRNILRQKVFRGEGS